MTEWKKIASWSYEASDDGQIRRVGSSIILKPWTDPNGYLHVKLHRHGDKKTILLHRLISKTFLGHRRKGQEVNHKNGVKSDNNRSNLEYCSHSRNMKHAYRTGLITRTRRGEGSPGSKLKSKDIYTIRLMKKSKRYTMRSIGNHFGVTLDTIYSVIKKRSWAHL